MARPKKSNTEEMATVKIENAFWKLLETEKYSEISVLRICQESGVNRNSFYYHYKDIDDLASTAFKNNAADDVSEALFSVLLSSFRGSAATSEAGVDPAILPHSKKIMLCASSNSVFLNRLVRDLLKQIWFDTLHINADDLSLIDELQVDFIFFGLTSILGRPEIQDSPLLMPELAQTEIGESAINAMKSIAAKQNLYISLSFFIFFEVPHI